MMKAVVAGDPHCTNLFELCNGPLITSTWGYVNSSIFTALATLLVTVHHPGAPVARIAWFQAAVARLHPAGPRQAQRFQTIHQI